MPPVDDQPDESAPDARNPAELARARVMAMTREAERAVTEPRDAGAWPHAWRLAVAARLAALAGQAAMARGYRERVDDADVAALSDPTVPGRDARERVVLAFMDKVAREPRTVVAEDIEGLKAAGVAEPDIVRLCELNAFLGYQCRVSAGLAAMGAAA